VNEQTLTDEQLQKCLDALDVQMRNGIKPKVCLYETPAQFPWMGMRHILQYEDEATVLTLSQAYQVEAWLKQHATGSPQVQAKPQSITVEFTPEEWQQFIAYLGKLHTLEPEIQAPNPFRRVQQDLYFMLPKQVRDAVMAVKEQS
jgi:hypothetical protein